MRRVGMMVFAAALGLAALTGCSGEEEPNASSNQSNTSEGSPEEGNAGTDGETDKGTDGGSDAAYCQKAGNASQELSGTGSTSQDMVEVYRDIAAVAPADIKDEWTTIADSLETMLAAQEGLTDPDMSDPDAAMKELEKKQQEMTEVSKELQAATKAVTTDSAERCSG